MSDVWEPQKDESRSGLTVNQVFSVDVVFRLGWAAVQRSPGLAAVAGGALVVLQVAPQLLQWVLGAVPQNDVPAIIAVAIASVAGSLAASAYTQFCLAGTYVAFARVYQGGPTEVSTVFASGRAGLNVFLSMLLTGLGLAVATALLFGPAIAAVIGGIALLETDPGSGMSTPLFAAALVWFTLATPLSLYVSMFAQLVPVIAALEPLGPIDAISRAWERADGARLTLFILSLALAFSMILACCVGFVGLIPLLAVYHAGLAAAWMLVSRTPAELREMEFFSENASDFLG